MKVHLLRGHLRLALVGTLLTAACGINACSAPVGVWHADPKTVHRSLARSVISSGQLSPSTQNVLFQRDLVELFDTAPEQALTAMHYLVVNGQARPRDIIALAELSFAHADDSRDSSYYLAAALYAYAYLFPEDPADTPSGFDPRFRLACEIYNRSLTRGLAGEDGEVAVRSATYRLPFGTLELVSDPVALQWGTRTLEHFIPVAELDVEGLATRYRWPGLGAPLAASTVATSDDFDFVEPWVKVPVTALLRIEGIHQQLRRGEINGSLDLIPANRGEVATLEGRQVPIEVESTATLAYMLAESPLWQQEIRGFLEGVGIVDEHTRLAAMAPPEHGRIPVVFIHGTASSAGRWAQMMNELNNDARIRRRYQFWLFSYNTGNPILYSSMLLRQSLEAAVKRIDPEGTDDALQRMVLIGHSQGGLLAKMATIDSGDQFWNDISKKPLASLDLAEDRRTLLQGMSFFTPLPFVRRAIFVATPQHGSYFAGNQLSHWVARFITLPIDIVHVGTDLLLRNHDALTFAAAGHMPTAVDNMTPGSRFIKLLASMPVTPPILAHSIIAVQGDAPAAESDDGIVAYESAHIEGVESELVVRSSHSCQDNPHVIEEVRRILLKHLKEP